MFRFVLLPATAGILAAALPAAGAAAPDAVPADPLSARVTVAPTRTSIYIGNVSLTLPPLTRHGEAYIAEYRARVFPFFFYGEHGRLSVDFPEESVRRLFRGEVVEFKGHALNSDGEGRRIEGRVVPEHAGANHGKIKIRVWVGKLELIFNSTYQFTDSG